MRKPVAASSNFQLSKHSRALLAAALLALGPVVVARGQNVDVATIPARAAQGDPEALNVLGNLLANGQGGLTRSAPEALRAYQQSADKGYAPALFNLGMMHELGNGVAADLPTAFKFYLKAAEQGFAPAQFNVGNMYANGIGVKQDFFEAALWFRQAADRQSGAIAEAQYNLALAL